MNEILYYIGIVAVIIFVLRLAFYWGYNKGLEDGMTYLANSVDKFFLSIGKKELYKIFLDFLYADAGGDLNKLNKISNEKDNSTKAK